jgi:hypothetical protein
LAAVAVIQYLAQLHQQQAVLAGVRLRLLAVRVVVLAGSQVPERQRVQREQQDKVMLAEMVIPLLHIQAAVAVQVPLAQLVLQLLAEMVEREQPPQ